MNLTLETGQKMRGYLTIVTPEGTMVYFIGESPAIGVESTAQLEFLRRDTRESLVLDAIATDYLQIDPTRETYRFRFLPSESLQRIQEQDFFSYFNPPQILSSDTQPK